MNKLIALDKKILLCLFPIMLFQSNGEEKVLRENTANHEMRYLRILERYILYILGNDHSQTAITLGLVTEIIGEFERI